MKSFGTTTIISALAALMLLFAACGQDSTPSFAAPDVSREQVSQAARMAAEAVNRTAGSSQQGLMVSGTGTASAEPDLAIINLGVQILSKSVSDALEQANTALEDILAVLPGYDVAEEDTQTQYFNISTQYEWLEDGQRKIVGYQVTNQLSVSVRNLDDLGDLITDVAEAGGNLVQINGINFSIEDTTTLRNSALELAVQAARDEADRMAELAGVTVGDLLFISQTGGATPTMQEDFRGEMASMSRPAAAVPVRSGSLEVTVYVQALYGIE